MRVAITQTNGFYKERIMAALNELLEYQTVDGDLRKIEQEIAASEERKKYVQAKKFMESAREKLETQDARAVELRRIAKDLTARYMQIKETIAEYSAVNDDVDDEGIAFYKRSAQQLSDTLRALKGEIAKLIAEIEAACEEYKKMKSQTIAMQKQYNEYSEKFKAVKAARTDEVNAINEKLNVLGKKIPVDILEKYRAKRKEKIFPILVPLTNDRCICGMDFAIAQQSALSGGNVIECEHCRRFIYKK